MSAGSPPCIKTLQDWLDGRNGEKSCNNNMCGLNHPLRVNACEGTVMYRILFNFDCRLEANHNGFIKVMH